MTTDEMDGITTDEAKERKRHVWYQCRKCADWTMTKNSDFYSYGPPADMICEHCGAHSFDPQSCTSHDTFNYQRLKKRKVR